MEETNCNFCGKDNLIFVKYITANDLIAIRKQCVNCGVLLKLNYKKKLFNLDNLPFMNLDKRKDNYKVRLENAYTRQTTSKFYNNVYLKSDEWKGKREVILKRDNNKCVCCNDKATQVHHITYDRVYMENLTDLISVCKDCHTKIHFQGNVFINGLKANFDILKYCYSCKKYHNHQIEGLSTMCLNCRVN